MGRIISFIFMMIVVGVLYSLIPGFEYPTEVGANNKYDKRFLQLLNEERVGGAYLISQDGEIKYEKYAGYVDYLNKKIINEDNLFSLGTLSQQYLGHIIFQLIESGAIDPNNKVGLYLNDLSGRLVGEQSIRNLLVMKSELPYDFKRGRIYKWQLGVEPDWEELYSQLTIMAPAIKCDRYVTDGCYSNISYMLLGASVEAFLKKDYKQIFDTRIKRAFDLLDTEYNVLDDDRMVRGHIAINENKMSFAPHWDHTYSKGNSGVRATLRDFHKFQLAISTQLNNMQYNPSKYFDLFNFSFGWNKEQVGGDTVFWHKGDDVGFQSLVVRVPDKDFIAIFLLNVDEHNRERFRKKLLREIFKILPKF